MCRLSGILPNSSGEKWPATLHRIAKTGPGGYKLSINLIAIDKYGRYSGPGTIP